MNYTLKELLDIPKLWELLDCLDDIHSMPSAIIDTEGTVLTATAWQDICTKFHRMNPDTEKLCIESDRSVDASLAESSSLVVYRCPMGLVEAAMPIVIEGRHLGNVFTGQLFMEPPDESYFIEQARRFGFDEDQYLAALRKVPFFSEERHRKNITFIHSLVKMLTEQGLQYIRQCESEAQLRENEATILAMKDTLQEQYEELQLNEESLRDQNDELLATEEMLREQINNFETSQNLLKESEERFRALHNASFGGIIIHDKGLILDCNQGLSDMTGFSAEELIGMNGLKLIAPGSLDQVLRNIQTGFDLRYEVEGVRKDGSKYPLEICGKNIPFKGRTVRVIEFRDVTDRKRAEVELQKKNAEIEQFIYTVSHDLRSPLVTVKTFMGYLEKDLLERNHEQLAQDIQYIHGAADKMKLLLDELLEMSRIGRVETPHIQVSTHELLEEALDALAGVISERKVVIRRPETDFVVVGDRPRLCQIWQNLIENAIKYSCEGRIPVIDLGVRQEDGQTVFYVKDNGIGIDPRYHSKIFGIFDKLDPKSPGAGLGLSMVQRIVEKCGGRIWVESEGNGTGSTFYFTLAG